MAESFELEVNVAKERADSRNRDVTVVGLRDRFGQVLMVRTARLPSRWQPIGGGIEPGDESPVQALIREVYEELGITLQSEDLELILKVPYDFGEGAVYFFEAKCDPSEQVLSFNENEIVEYQWLDLAQAQRLPVFPATEKFLVELLARQSNVIRRDKVML